VLDLVNTVFATGAVEQLWAQSGGALGTNSVDDTLAIRSTRVSSFFEETWRIQIISRRRHLR
jgi:hypothetical protein